MNTNLKDAAAYIFHAGLLYKFGTGANSIGTDACLKQQAYVENRFSLTHAEFSEAFKMAERLDAQEAEAEKAFLKSHPELNP